MKVYKIFALLLIFLLLFSGCRNDNQTQQAQVYSFTAEQSNIFPFYCIGEDDMLWRIERHGAYSLKKKVNYVSGSNELNFVRYLKEKDTVIFATNILVENGQTIADICQKNGQEQVKTIAEKIKLESLRLQNNGDMLFVDEKDTLFFRRDGIVIKIEEGVAQSEFVNEETFLFRLKKGKEVDGEYLYPIYSATGDYRNYMMDGLDILATDSVNGKAYIIKNKHTVQKRTASCQVATLFVYADGEILFELPSVVLSQFEQNKHIFVLTCNENEPTLTYDLYRIDSSEAVLKAKNIIWGKYISINRDVFAYETMENNIVKTNIIDYTDNLMAFLLGESCSLENIYYCKGNIYILEGNKFRALENGKVSDVLLTDIDAVQNADTALILFKRKTPPYEVLIFKDKMNVQTVGNIQSNNVLYNYSNLYYYIGENNDLCMSDANGKVTAFISNVDKQIGFIAYDDTVAVAKYDDKTLHIATPWGILNASLKIKKFVQEV
ncbi:MAG: hypothetical protein E7365_03485 [Clostridiales bacterium]|nr:hypothetical protein [Clostridiales bacterium]